MLMAGILPFGAVFIELFFILTVIISTNNLICIYVYIYVYYQCRARMNMKIKILFILGNLGESILLLIWIFVPCFCDSWDLLF